MKIKIRPIRKEYEKLLELYPPITSNKITPDWYRKMKVGTHYGSFTTDNILTAKNCPAIQDIVTTGFIIPIWANLYFKTEYATNGNKIMQYWDITSRVNANDSVEEFINHHPSEQTEGMDINRNINNDTLKLKLPYYFDIPDGYNILYTDPFYHFRKDIRCLSGIVEGDKWGYVNLLFEILKDNFEIKAGSPLVHALIYKREDEKLILDINKGTDEEYAKVRDDFIELFTTRKTYRTKNENEKD
jgi:hypothetical protein